jgi:hypothetical protein
MVHCQRTDNFIIPQMNGRKQAFELAFEERDGYLYARIDSRAITPERSEEYLGAVVDRCHELGCTRLLIERHIPQALSNLDAYKVVTALAESIPPGLRMAFVDSNSNNRKRLEFGTGVARSKKLDARVYGSVEEAEEWLLRP